jgi:hypothetical protein
MAQTPDIRVKLTPEGVNEVIAAMRRVKAEADEASKGNFFSKLGSSVSEAINPINALKAALPALGLAALAIGLKSATLGVTEFADNAGKAAQRIGTDAENFSTLAFGAKTAELSQEELEKSLGRTSKAVSELRNGNGQMADSFGELGLSIKDFAGKDTAQAFELISKRIIGVADGSDRVRLAMDIMGRSGARLLPLMKDVAEKGLAGMTEEAQKFGAFVSSDMAAQAELFNDNLTRMEVASQRLARQLIGGHLSALNEITSAASEAAKEHGLLYTLFIAFGGVVDKIFNGSEITKQKNAIADLQTTIEAQQRILDSGKQKVPFLPFDVKLTEQSMEQVKASLDKNRKELADRQKQFDDLTKPKAKDKTATGGDTEAEAFDAQKRIGDLTKRLRLDDLKSAEEVANKQRAIQEAQIKLDNEVLAARLSGSTNALAVQKALDEAAAKSTAARTQLARDSFEQDIASIKARETALLTSLDTERAALAAQGQSTKRQDETISQVTKQSLDQRLAATQTYYQKLLVLQNENLTRYKQAQEAIKAIDKEVHDNKINREKSFEDIRIAGLSAEEQQSARIRQANELLDQMRDARAKGDLDTLRKLREQVVGLGVEIAKTPGFLNLGKNLAEDADDILNMGLAVKKFQEQAKSTEAADAVKSTTDRLKELSDQVKTLTEQKLSTIDLKFGVDQAALTDMINNIKEQLRQTTFGINVTPNVSGGTTSAPAFAEGGLIPGMSPHPRADDKLIWATSNEYVMPVNAVKHYGTGFMEMIRSMNFPRFADGGMVGGGSAGGIQYLDLTFNKRSIGQVSGPRDTIDGLISVLQQVSRGT